MKIEIAEILIASYLKHIEGCRIVQTNWKTSGKWNISEYDKEKAVELFERIKQSTLLSEIFKKNSFNQLIKQAEIDVLGLNTTESAIFGIDVAFHTAGLNYGKTEETVTRIIKKVVRTVFIMQTYFKEFDKFNSYFVSPKVNPVVNEAIKPCLKEMQDLINDDFIHVDFISNTDFYERIVDPLSKEISDENDTSELFSRALKLIQLDKRRPTANVRIKSQDEFSQRTITDKHEENGMKIGQFVQYHFRKAWEDGLITSMEIQNLQDPGYCKRIFNQDFEILKHTIKSIKDAKGRTRYYSKELFCGEYYLTSQWFERHWEPFKHWLNQLKI
ncbi:hypothetical protein [Saccharicrinis sp. FJH54]|uniref:hypothetical protein n=1 Tax=Saccharicrinis sp. FJH54 TaxID=3344665 RepID=UPI0035D47959